jgi:transcriptional regulator with XRE-family HTH domain
MTTGNDVTWDGHAGTAGGAGFAAALETLLRERGMSLEAFAVAAELTPADAGAVVRGERRVTVPELARIAGALRLRALEFLQRAQVLSLEVYALGLDPLYFLPDTQVRKDARIYMREINPRHAVPERDMFARNPALKALLDDEMLDAPGKLELQIAYLLRVAVQSTGGTL